MRLELTRSKPIVSKTTLSTISAYPKSPQIKNKISNSWIGEILNFPSSPNNG